MAPAYHAALWARERDRQRQDVLEHLGWRFHRIWSTDWFHDRRSQTERLRAALLAAHEAAGTPVPLTGANDPALAPPASAPVDEPPSLPPEPLARAMPPYRRAQPRTTSRAEPHDAPLPVLLPLVREVVEVEGPIHLDEIARRIAGAFGAKSAGRRIVAATLRALTAAARADPTLTHEDGFWFTATQAASPPVRDRSVESGPACKADALSLLEVRAALAIAREDNPGGADDELVRSAARLLGFRRVGADLAARIGAGLR